MGQESLIMKLYTFARTRNECGGHGVYRDEQHIERFGPHFPPVFLSVESAKAWQEKITNPLTNDKDHSPIGAVGASKPESNSAAPIG
jgi:hypothetical protein